MRGRDPVQLATCLAVAVVVVVYGQTGGAYDLVTRQELGVGAWLVVGLGALTGALPRARLPRPALAGLAGFALLGTWTAVTLQWTQSDERTVEELARIVHHAGVVVLLLCLLGPRTWKAAAAGLTLGVVAIGLVSFTSRLAPSLFPGDPVNHVFPGPRLNYPLDYWNAVAAWCAIGAGLCVAWSLHAERRWLRALALGAIPPLVAAGYVTYSRTGPVVAGVVAIALLALSPRRLQLAAHLLAVAATGAGVIAVVHSETAIARNTGTAGAGAVLLVVIAAALALAGVSLAIGSERLRSRAPVSIGRAGRIAAVAVALLALGGSAWAAPRVVKRVAHGLQSPAPANQDVNPAVRFSSLSSGRTLSWGAAVDAHRAHPWQGIGPGTFEFTWNRDRRYDTFLRDAHSLYLEWWAEAGWPGLAAIVLLIAGLSAGALVVLTRLAPRSADRGIAAGLLAAFVGFAAYAGFDWAWEATAIAAVGLGSVAIALAAGSSAAATPPRRVSRAALTLVAAGLVLVQLPPLVSTSEVRVSKKDVERGDASAALTHADDAIAASPWSATPYVQRALVLEETGQFAPALADLQRARSREPTNYTIPLTIARVEAELGHPASATTWFGRARALAPRKTEIFGTG